MAKNSKAKLPQTTSGKAYNQPDKTSGSSERRSAIADALNKSLKIFTSYDEETFDEVMANGVRSIADGAGLDHIGVYRFTSIGGDMSLVQMYRWDRTSGGSTLAAESLSRVPDTKAIECWFAPLSKGEFVIRRASDMSKDELEFVGPFGIKSIMLVPIFTHGTLWGIVSFQDHTEGQYFDEDCAPLLCSAACLCANAIIKADMAQSADDALQALKHRKKMTDILNKMSVIFLSQSEETFEDMMAAGVEPITDMINLDRLSVWRNSMMPDGLHASQIYRWERKSGGTTAPLPELADVAYNKFAPRWEKILLGDETINGPAQLLPESGVLKSFGVVSAFIAPVFINNAFWGCVLFEDCRNERFFDDDIAEMMRSAAFLCANTVIRTEMEREVKDALHNMTVASKAKSEFLSNMSHEMRTPLNAIIGMTAIGKKATDMERKNYTLNKIEEASSHLLGVINDVLDMSKIEANMLELSPVEFNFDKMLQKAVTVVNFRVGEKRQRLFVNVDGKVPRFVVGDDQRLAQVITNLLSNAVKFTPEEGEIRLDAALAGEEKGICELRIAVSDNGIGISREQQEHLFRAFGQAESGTSRKFGGTGLGLAISKRIVELMDGKIWVESELGKGATFIFTVKVGRGEQNIRSMLNPSINWKSVRVLTVDGEEETRKYFKSVFGRLGIKCDVADSSDSARRLIEESDGYNIYFVDWGIKDMDDVILAEQSKPRGIKNPSVVTLIPAVGLAMISDDSDAHKYLLKPMLSSMLIDCANECLVADRGQNEADTTDRGEFEGKRLLIAEDVEINREIILALLEDTGLIIDTAENGKQALDMVEEAPDKYDMVFMDVQMPEIDGLEATRRIRGLPAMRDRKRKLPIVAMTANVFKDDIDNCLAAGMNDHVGKPLDVEEVFEKLRQYLR